MQQQAAEFGIGEARRVLGEVFAPWVKDLNLSIEGFDFTPPPGAAADWQPGAILRMPFAERLCRNGGVVCGQALMAFADTSMVLANLAANRGYRPRHADRRHRQQAGGDGLECIRDVERLEPRRALIGLTSPVLTTLLAENFFRRIDDADGWILSAVFAELLGVRDKHVGIDDRLVGIALVPAVHPGQHHHDGVLVAFDELFAVHGREIEHGGIRRRGREHERCCEQDRNGRLHDDLHWRVTLKSRHTRKKGTACRKPAPASSPSIVVNEI
jgi:hypothetical protein